MPSGSPSRGLLVLAAALILLVVPGLAGAADDPPGPTVTWGGQVFESDLELARWLRARGIDYYTWAARHPEASSQIERGRPVPTLPAAPAAGSSAPAEDADRRALWLPVVGGALLGLVLLLAAVLPERLLAGRRAEFLGRYRMEVAGLAVVLLVGAGLTVAL